MVDSNREVSVSEGASDEELLKRNTEHEEVMERFRDDIQQTIW